MTGLPANFVEEMARDIRWALDALRAGEPETAERILSHSFEKYVMVREGEQERLAHPRRNV